MAVDLEHLFFEYASIGLAKAGRLPNSQQLTIALTTFSILFLTGVVCLPFIRMTFCSFFY